MILKIVGSILEGITLIIMIAAMVPIALIAIVANLVLKTHVFISTRLKYKK